MIAPTAVIAGIGLMLGFDVIKAPGATGYYDSDLMSKANVAVNAIKQTKYNFGFIHIKAVDDSGHDGNLEIKNKFLQIIDGMIGMMVD